MTAPATRRSCLRRLRFAAARALRGVTHLADTPHRIALGSATGLFVMPLPLPGQMVLGPILARLIGGNVLASIPWTWVNNPFTFLFFIYGQYRLGLLLVPGDDLTFAGLAEVVERFNHLPWSEALGSGMSVLGGILLPLAIGSLLVAAGCAGLGYLVVRWLVGIGQARKKARHAGWRRGGSSGTGGVGAGTGS